MDDRSFINQSLYEIIKDNFQRVLTVDNDEMVTFPDLGIGAKVLKGDVGNKA